MTVKDALRIATDPTALSKVKGAEAKDILKTLTREAQSIFKEVKAAGSPGAARLYHQYGDRFPTVKRGLSPNQMKHYIGILGDYFTSGTSTVEQTERWQEHISNTLNRGPFQFDFGSMSTAEKRNFFKWYNDIANSGDESLLTQWANLDSNQRAQLIMEVKSKKFKSRDARTTYFYNRLHEMSNEIRARASKGFGE